MCSFRYIGGTLGYDWCRHVSERAQGLRLYWLAAILLGPILYIFVGPFLFGQYFHYFNWEIPRRWSSFGIHTLRRYFGYIALSYPIQAFTAGLTVLWKFFKDSKKMTIWHVQFVFALLTGLMGSLDAGSSHNVYIPMGMWFILLGMIGLREFSRKREAP